MKTLTSADQKSAVKIKVILHEDNIDPNRLLVRNLPPKPQISSVLFDVFGKSRILAGLCMDSVCLTIITKKT